MTLQDKNMPKYAKIISLMNEEIELLNKQMEIAHKRRAIFMQTLFSDFRDEIRNDQFMPRQYFKNYLEVVKGYNIDQVVKIQMNNKSSIEVSFVLKSDTETKHTKTFDMEETLEVLNVWWSQIDIDTETNS